MSGAGALALLGLLAGAGGIVLLLVAFAMLGNAARFGVPAPLRWRRIRLAGGVLLGLGVVLLAVARLVVAFAT